MIRAINRNRGLASLLALMLALCVLPALMDPTRAQDSASGLWSFPAPSAVVPPSEAVAGSAGADQAFYALADHVHPRITRTAVVSTDASGNWAVAWSTPLPSSSAVFTIPVNAGSLPVTCNVTAKSTTAASGKCWGAQSVLLNLSIIMAGLSLTPDVAVGAGVQVQIIAVPTTQ